MRYFDPKADVLWYAFDTGVVALRAALNDVPNTLPLMDAIRAAVVSVNHYTAADMPELHTRVNLISSVPEIQASAVVTTTPGSAQSSTTPRTDPVSSPTS